MSTITEKIQVVNKFFENILNNCELDGLIQNYEYSNTISDSLFTFNSFDTAVNLRIRKYGNHPIPTSDYFRNHIGTNYVNWVSIASKKIRTDKKAQFHILIESYHEDTISTETSLDDLDEMCFEFSLLYGTDIELMELKLAVLYVLYKHYLPLLQDDCIMYIECNNNLLEILSILES